MATTENSKNFAPYDAVIGLGIGQNLFGKTFLESLQAQSRTATQWAVLMGLYPTNITTIYIGGYDGRKLANPTTDITWYPVASGMTTYSLKMQNFNNTATSTAYYNNVTSPATEFYFVTFDVKTKSMALPVNLFNKVNADLSRISGVSFNG